MFRSASLFVCLAAVVAGAAPPPAASTLHGTVLDPSGSPVEKAFVSAVPGGQPVLTDGAGKFALELFAGRYTLTVTRDGFAPAARPLDWFVGAPDAIEIVLQLAPMQSVVTVQEGGGYLTPVTSTATKTPTPLVDIPQSITVVSRELIQDQMMMSIADVVRYVPGISSHQGENNRDQLVIRGNSSSADFFVDGVRDDVQYYRDLYNLERVEALKGPNAVTFGRGGAGGVVNRVTKDAGFGPLHEITLQGGSFGKKRVSADFNQLLSERVAVRFNGMYDDADSFRNFVGLTRYGVSPALAWAATDRTRVTLHYEHFHDGRTSDRGITSFQGRPADVPVETYYGNPDQGWVRADVNLGAATVEHQRGRWNLRNRMHFGDYDRGYQNFVPGAASADRSTVALSAYNNATARRNFFNQTDVSGTFKTGRIRHVVLTGVEAGLQLTDNFRNTGYFNNSVTSIAVPFDNPLTRTPVVFRQSATDADNHLRTNLAATYLQDQVELARFFQVTAGVRIDRFDLNYRNNRTGERLGRVDNMLSPRAGVVFKPAAAVSLYGSYSVSYLPSSGDQFSSLTTITQQVKPEKFENYEAGVKWDAARGLSLTTAVYRLDRTNTRSTDPNDPTRIVQTGSQRSNGLEVGASGSLTHKWRLSGGYTYQDAFVTSATTAARPGAQVAQVPHHSFSLWNNYQVVRRVSAGLGLVNRADMFATIDNSVRLPGYTRADAALFYNFAERMRLQVNVENLTGRRYYMNADSNTNISPGSPRAVRVGLIARF